MNQGLKDLVDNYEDWAREIEAGPANPKYATAFSNLRNAMNKIVNVNKNLSDGFYTSSKNMKLMEAAAKGDLNAVSELRKEAAKEILFGVNFDKEKLTEEQTALNNLIDNKIKEYQGAEQGLVDCEEMLKEENDSETKKMIEEEIGELRKKLPTLKREVELMLLPKDEADEKNAILEICGKNKDCF